MAPTCSADYCSSSRRPLLHSSCRKARRCAEPDDGAGGEQRDIAVPISDSELAEQEAAVQARPDAPAIAATTPIDDFRYDELRKKGKASEICAGSIGAGTMWTFNELTSRFGGSAGSMYSCRERWDFENDPDCNGTIVDPVQRPNFFSTCWSNHSQGRAMDIMVGSNGYGGYNTARGRAIIRWLLAPDEAGNQNARARRLGVQQILFDDRCWDADGDRGTDWWSDMRECGIGHHDHVHIDLTVNGASGNVSWWGATPEIGPKLNSILSTNTNDAKWSVRRFVNLEVTRTRASSWDRVWPDVVAGDWDGDGRQDDVILWNPSSGRWAVRAFSGSKSYFRGSGTWTGRYDMVVPGDFNADGRVNELFLYRRATGRWQVQRWEGFTVRRRVTGGFSTTYDRLMAADLNGNGRVDELLLWDVNTQLWKLKRFTALKPYEKSSGRWGPGWTQIFVGDFDSDGELDESLLWNTKSGEWLLQNWVRNQAAPVRRGAFDRAMDDFVVVDADTDGRLDDAVVRDTQTGEYTIHRWHLLDRQRIRTGRWTGGIEHMTTGSWH